jgi:hypothetical protein
LFGYVTGITAAIDVSLDVTVSMAVSTGSFERDHSVGE